VTATAFGLVVLSALLHAVWSASIKGSREPLAFNLVQALATSLVGIGVFAAADLSAIPGGVWWALAGTSLAHALYFLFLSIALTRGELTLVYPIARSTPAFLPFLAVPLLGESISTQGALGIATVVAGMWLVHSEGRLSFRALLGPGTGFAYLTLATTVGYSLADKAAMAELSAAGPATRVPHAILFYFLLSTASTALFAPLAAAGLRARPWAETMRLEWGRALGAAAMSFVSYVLILEAYRAAPASYVVAVRQTSVLFAVVIGIFHLRERPGRARLLGALATVAGVALVGIAD
jgi:drug/metabolite transporter (DMT)-like permease